MNEIYSAFYLDFSKEIFKGNVSFLMSPRAAKPCASSYGLSETGQTEVGVNKTTEKYLARLWPSTDSETTPLRK